MTCRVPRLISYRISSIQKTRHDSHPSLVQEPNGRMKFWTYGPLGVLGRSLPSVTKMNLPHNKKGCGLRLWSSIRLHEELDLVHVAQCTLVRSGSACPKKVLNRCRLTFQERVFRPAFLRLFSFFATRGLLPAKT